MLTVEEEIEVLRRQLEAKEATAKGLRAEVDGYESDIHRIRDKFSRQLTRVERKEASVKENRFEWEKEKIAHDTAKLAHDKEVEAHHAALVAHDALMEKLRKEIALADAFKAIVAAEVVFEKTADQDLESDGEYAQLQADVVKSEAAVSEGRQILKAAEAALSELKEERDSLLKQIPLLEKTKTEAAACRDFKAAGKASKQIKDAKARLMECQEELSGEATERKDAAVEELTILEKDLKEKKAVLNEQEKEAGRHAMKMVADKIKRLAETKKSVCGGAMDAAGIQAVGAFVLNGQVEALMREGSACGEKYGGWDEIAEELTKTGVLDTIGTARNSGTEGPTSSDVSPGGRPADEVDPEVIAKFRAATRRLQEVEEAINVAVAKDDFETADKLNEELEEIKVEWEAIDLTAAEIKIFEGDDDLEEIDESAPKEEQQSEDVSVESSDDQTEEELKSTGECSPESEPPQDANSGDSGYVSEEGTELIDDSNHDSEALIDQEEDGGTSSTDKEPYGQVEDSETASLDDTGGEKDDDPHESIETGDDNSYNEKEAEQEEKPVENGTSSLPDADENTEAADADKVDEKTAVAVDDEEETPSAVENGH